MYIPRHEQILTIISTERDISVLDLSQRLGVSEVTIRKDLTTLEHLGCLIRTRGGARIAEDFRLIRTLAIRSQEHIPEKQAIAECAAEMLSSGDTVYFDAGSTCLAAARAVRSMNLHVVTNSLDIMAELSSAPSITLTTPGGSYRKESGAFVGPTAVRFLQQLQFSLCIIGTTGFSRDGIFSAQNALESEMKRQAIENSARRIIVTDSSKFGIHAYSIFAQAKEIDILITDSGFKEPVALEALGISIVIAGKKRPLKQSP